MVVVVEPNLRSRSSRATMVVAVAGHARLSVKGKYARRTGGDAGGRTAPQS